MFKTVLVANRGEIAGRIIRTLHRMGIRAVAVASDADRFTPPMRQADHIVRLGGGPPASTYLDIAKIIAACRETGAEAVHPGYGFLSENLGFAERLEAEGIAFIGPRPTQIRAFGLKHEARAIAERGGVPLLPGSRVLKDQSEALDEAMRIGYPVMLKSTAGGGGIGMYLCRNETELAERYVGTARLASGNFGDARLFLERFVEQARHIEVQIFGDGKGGIVALGERDCSLQRRNQKVVEESPAPGLTDAVRARLRDYAVALGREVSYESAGTVEFVYDAARAEPYFLEVNTRLQVEHPVTEEIFGVDLVEWMVRQAAGVFTLPLQETLKPKGHAIEVRLYAENPARDFHPATGTVTELRFPNEARIESWIETGSEITALYDPMLAKLIVKDDTRDEAIAKLGTALKSTVLAGLETNLAYLQAAISDAAFREGRAITATLKTLPFAPNAIEVVTPGAGSSLQDWPGRLHYWNVGIPPSGPMDSRAHRLANRIVGNGEEAAALECTLSGPALKFLSDAVIALAGARMRARLDGTEIPYHTPQEVCAGQTLSLGTVEGPGMRTYLAVRGGFDAPFYLGSRATFSLGGFGGHATGVLKAGDTLHFGDAAPAQPVTPDAGEVPALTHDWEIGVLYGPHGAPDFFTAHDIAALFSSAYEVHFNSARTGVRLIGPQPEWARKDGGEAGLHPSNLHDNAYAIGAIDFTGDMPIILGPDGPSLGGFVCPAVVTKEELWKVGQLRPGDRVRFVERAKEKPATPFLMGGSENSDGATVYRRAGSENILIEFGPMALDLSLRLKAHLFMEALQKARLPGILDLTPGIRSLQLHYDSAKVSEAFLLGALAEIEKTLPDPHSVEVPSRIVHLPLSWDDPEAQLSMRKYQELVRPNAPWCPSNIEFIRRINGLSSEEDVRRIVFEADYLVMGLGDVYLGAPVATPLDPRHRLVTTKYNPARTWTPENAVGIGGAYLCIYGMEGPGGYQLVGRTIQMWNRWRRTAEFADGKPWLLRFFDQIKFFPVSGEELQEARAAFPHGLYPVKIEETRFSISTQEKFLAAHRADIASFKARQQSAFEEERARWEREGLDSFVADIDQGASNEDDVPLESGVVPVHAPSMGTVWKIEVAPGERVRLGQPVVIIESMKMEIAIPALSDGIVRELRCEPGKLVKAGQVVALLKEDA